MAAVLMSVILFFTCATLWAQLFPIENVCWLAGTLSIYGEENIYDLAAALGIIISGAGSLALTWLSLMFLRRNACRLTLPHTLKDKHRRHQHGGNG